jgi:hypothetical protein
MRSTECGKEAWSINVTPPLSGDGNLLKGSPPLTGDGNLKTVGGVNLTSSVWTKYYLKVL